MTSIEWCKALINRVDCALLDCRKCPLNNGDKYDCSNHMAPQDAAIAYLKDHEEKTFPREEAFSSMIKGERVVPADHDGTVKYCYYDANSNYPFVVMFSNGITDIMDEYFAHRTWKLYTKEPVQLWQFAVKVESPESGTYTAEITEHMTEAQATEMFGKDIIKLDWSIKYEYE